MIECDVPTFQRHGTLLWCISSRFRLQCEGIIQYEPNSTLHIYCIRREHPSVRIAMCVEKINKACTCVSTGRWETIADVVTSVSVRL